MAWFYLVAAGLLEIFWAVGLKHTHGFTRLWPSVGTVAAIIASLALLALALRSLSLGTAYAIWTGIGIVGTAILGMTLLGETVSLFRVVCVALILTGIVGLKLATPTP